MKNHNTNPGFTNHGFTVAGLFGIALFILVIAGCNEQSPPAEQDNKTKYGDMNISRFVYRDINRNGIYDLGDRPYAGQAFLLKSPDGKQKYGRSNISGFANFKMSRNNPEHPIHAAGQYELNAVAQSGMQFTSGDPDQTLDITELPGSPAGLISEHTLQPLGIAPELTISGRVKVTEDQSPDQYKLIAMDDNGIRQDIKLDSDGYYDIPSHTGHWTLQLDHEDTESSRRLVVRDNPVVLSEFSLATENITAGSGRIRLINFDNLTTSDTLFEIPNGYGGLDWHNWIATHHKFYNGAGYINNTLSGEFIAYNSSGHPARISSDKPFDLVSFSLGVAWPKAEQGTVTVSAWRGDKLAYRDEFKGSTMHPIIIVADYRDITRVEFRTSHYWQLVIDDLQYIK